MFTLADGTAIQFRKPVNEIMAFILNAVVHRKVNDFHIFRDVVAFYELFGITVCCTEEYYVYSIKRQFVCKDQIGFTVQSFVYVSDFVACIAGAVYELYFYIGVVDKQANQFACRISSPSYNSCFNHENNGLVLVE